MAYKRKRSFSQTGRKRRRYGSRRRMQRRRGIRGYGGSTVVRPIPNGGYPLGLSKMVRHRYAEQFALDPAIGTPANYIFRCNSLFDPNYTAAGHQPYGFDTMTTMFNHYTVIGAKITFSTVASDTIAFIMALRVNDDVSGITNTTLYLESPGVVSKLCGTSNYSGTNTIRMSWSAKKFFRKTGLVADADYKGSSSSSPNEQAYFNCTILPVNSTDNVGSIPCNVVIDYIAVWTEPNELGQS